MATLYAVIMAGGRGERFWPLSSDEVPKPFVPLLGPTTLLQDAVARLQPLIPPDRIYVSIGAAHEPVARQQLPELPAENFIVEPVGRDTSACLGYAALHLERRDPDAVMVALPADHFINDTAAYQRTLKRGVSALEGATAVVFGITPLRPDTGYGYVQAEKPAIQADGWPVLRFVEKPDMETAQGYLRAGNFFWNSGIFLWANRTLLALFQRHMPDTYEGLNRLREHLGTGGSADAKMRIFSGLRRISIDFGILEKAAGLRLVPADFGWDDIGNWASLARALPADQSKNVSSGSCLLLESSDCIAYSDMGTIAAFGVSGLVLVHARGKVLVCPRERASDLKKLVAALSPADK